MPITLSGQNNNTGIAMGPAVPLQNAVGSLGTGNINVGPQVNGATTDTPNNLNTGNGGYVAPRPVLNTAAIANTQKSLDQLPLILQQALAASLQAVSYTNLRAHETVLDLVCRLPLEKKKDTTHDPR